MLQVGACWRSEILRWSEAAMHHERGVWEMVGLRHESKSCHQTAEEFRRGEEHLKENLAV